MFNEIRKPNNQAFLIYYSLYIGVERYLDPPSGNKCRTVAMWKETYDMIRNYFDGKTIADLMKNE